MDLVQLVYYSRNLLADDDKGQLKLLREILSIARQKNVERDVTGYLIFDKHWFIQILEGDRAHVRATYERIARDPRHTQVTLLDTKPVRQRTFSQWSMGGAMRNLDQQEVFLAHGIAGQIDPTKLNAAKIVAVASDLAALSGGRASQAA
ncbi:BLUF domain-containing protein [Salinarimonas soli]|uniref:BLUF domain-containing protein n=1 Tax=Salinarimonas soli TaxID=1638099 RepID=A0A5B2V6Y2_9HYPH|nr:BLUF domain-containing protein [Salinarimonas soli]KAA2234608.1 BLUF domain-containing protein [Salinarimonas soli]